MKLRQINNSIKSKILFTQGLMIGSIKDNFINYNITIFMNSMNGMY